MRQLWIVCSLVVLLPFGPACRVDAQTNDAVPYSLKVSVDEVSLTFHAADADGLPINDLHLDELTLLDNGRPPHEILDFRYAQSLPIRAGILMDMSRSMDETFSSDQAIATQYAQQVLRQRTDQAFVMKFDRLSQVGQPWTSDAAALARGIRNHLHIADGGQHFTGTAIFDSLYRACLDEFGHIPTGASGNFILLFSDGEDNASRISLHQAIDMCQHTNTAIYAFRPESKDLFSGGGKILRQLTAESGGRIFHSDDPKDRILEDLRIIEADRRNQYRLIYRPAGLKRDGSFHRIEVKGPARVDSLIVRSGYYAPAR